MYSGKGRIERHRQKFGGQEQEGLVSLIHWAPKAVEGSYPMEEPNC